MRRLIDANALKELFPDNGEGSWTYNVTVKACIDAQPPIDAEPVKHGHWILSEVQDEEENANGNYRYRCSCCGYSDLHAKNQTVPYCWHCGARMDQK